MVFRKKPEPKSLNDMVAETYAATSPAPKPAPTLLQKERDKLAAAQATLRDLQNVEHHQHAVIAHLRENIDMLETHPWFEKLYEELREQDVRTPLPQGFVESVAQAKESGLLPGGPGPSSTILVTGPISGKS